MMGRQTRIFRSEKQATCPKGVVLDVKTIGCDYELSNEEYISAFPFSVSVNEKPLEINGRYNQSWKIDADSDLEFDAVFKGMLQKEQTVSRDFLCFKNTGGWYSDTTGMYGAGTLPDKQLTIYNYKAGKDLGYSGVKDLEIQSVMFNDSPVYEKLFSISRNGVFHAEKPLENGSYEIEVICKLNGEEEEFTLGIDVGIWIDASIPLATYKGSAANNYTYTIDAGGCAVKADADDTFADVFEGMKKTGEMPRLLGHSATGLGVFDQGAYDSFMNLVLRDYVDEEDPWAGVDFMYDGYKPAEIAPLSKEDIVPEEVEPGWHQQNGKWYFYETEDPASLVKNQWITCPEGNGCTEQVWVGADGAMAVNGVVNAQGKSYLVAKNGHKVKGKTVTLNDVTYTTDGDGEITEAKVILATPSNASTLWPRQIRSLQMRTLCARTRRNRRLTCRQRP